MSLLVKKSFEILSINFCLLSLISILLLGNLQLTQAQSIRNLSSSNLKSTPIARSDSFNICKDVVLSFSATDLLINDSDPDGKPIKVEYIVDPATGLLTDDNQGNFTYTPEPGFIGTVILQYVIKEDDGIISFKENKHYYEFVVSPRIAWEEANNLTEYDMYQGMQGYLVTITSEAENAFVSERLLGQGWIGASDKETEGVWKWVTGPEAGTQFSDQQITNFCQAITGRSVNGQYSNWYEGEPNNCTGEDYAHFYPGGVWNDYPNYVEDFPEGTARIMGYIVEYGGLEDLVDLTTTGTIVINVNASPSMSIITENVKCYGESNGSIQLNISDGLSPYEFNWSTGEISQNIKDLVAGEYSLILKDSIGCFYDTTLLISQPDPLISILPPDTASCLADPIEKVIHLVSGGTEPYSFLWSNGDTTRDLLNVFPGRYSVTLVDANGCSALSDFNFSQPDSPFKVEVSTSDYHDYSVSCFGSSNGSIDLSLSGGYPGVDGYDIDWHDGFEGEDRTGLSAGHYLVVVTDSAGCFKTLDIELTEPPKLELELSPSVLMGGYNIACAGASSGSVKTITSGGTLPLEFLWSNGDVRKDLWNIGAGTYSLVLTDINGCSQEASVLLTEPEKIEYELETESPTCNICDDGSISISGLRGGTGPFNISWNNLERGNTLAGIGIGDYRFTITDANNCVVSERITLDMGLRIPNAFTPNSDGYNDTWEIKLLESYPLSIVKIFNMSGQLVFESPEGYPEAWDGIFDGKALPMGTYYYLIFLAPDMKPFTGNLTIIR